MTKIKYIVGRSNLAATIFVPYDCPNNCHFCTSKEEYKNSSTFSLTKIIAAVKKIGPLPQITDFVITGGEPFADLKKLQKILDTCKKFNKHIYINTTLPVQSNKEKLQILDFIIKNELIISGINISRHMCLKTKLEDDSLIALIHKMTTIPLRINSVLLDLNIEDSRVLPFIIKYAPIVNSINFRGNYNKIKTQDDLRALDHPILNILFNIDQLQYLSSGGCLVCNNNDFRLYYQPETRWIYVSLHRGFEHSLVVRGNTYIINDIIIKQDGKILADWDNKNLNYNELRKQWLN